MAKKIPLEQKIDALTSIVEKGFATADKKFEALAEDIASIDEHLGSLATKDQVVALHTQVNSIERQLRDTKTETRLSDLEEKVFGGVRR